MARPVLYHNPQCSKSRAAVALATDGGADVEVVRYLDTPLTRDQLAAVLAKLDGSPRSLVRTGEARFRELGVDRATLDDPEAVADLLAAEPRLMERPLLVTDTAAVIGRPTEALTPHLFPHAEGAPRAQ